MRIHVLLNPDSIHALADEAVAESHCVVIDVLRATTSVVTAFAHGARAVCPVRTVGEARELARGPGDDRVLLAGERQGDRIDGFDLGNSPSEFTRVAGRRLVMTTTNGTVALDVCRPARRTVAAALLNLRAVVDDLVAAPPERVMILCAGTFERTGLEDVYAAGRILDELDRAGRLPPDGIDDAARVARCVSARWPDQAGAALRASENGRALMAAGRESDIDWAARTDAFPVVPRLEADGWLRCPSG